MGRAGFRRWTIDYDLPCEGCGYSLRGLRPGERCPECGRVTPPLAPSEDRHLLHRADPAYLHRLVQGTSALLAVIASACAAFVAALALKADSTAAQLGALALCVAWGGAWQLAAGHDASQSPGSPYNATARHARFTAALASIVLSVHLAAALFHVQIPDASSWKGTLIGVAVVVFYLASGAIVLLHLATAAGYRDAVVYRARRVVPNAGWVRVRWWMVPLGLVTIPFSLAIAAAVVVWQIRRAGVAAIRADASA